MRHLTLALCGLAISACAEEALDTASPTAELGAISQDLSAIVLDPAAAGLVALNEAPVPSHAIADAWIRVWSTPEAAADYLEIRPDEIGSGAALPEGTLIIREVYDAEMTLTKSTIIVREGDPDDVGGWLFGVYGTDGQVSTSEEGAAQFGVLDECSGCHLARAEDDYLFGMPR